MVFLADILLSFNLLKLSMIALKNRFSVDSAYQDFAKAFDTVVHYKLLFKLESYGIDGH